jgi:hypothetical protein
VARPWLGALRLARSRYHFGATIRGSGLMDTRSGMEAPEVRQGGAGGTLLRLRMIGLLAVVALLASIVSSGIFARADTSAGERATGPRHHVAISLGGPVLRVPRSFLGLSVENNEVVNYERHRRSFLRFIRLLAPEGDPARPILRIGGESADSSFWGPQPWRLVRPRFRQRRGYILTDRWMKQLGSLVAAAGVNVILDLNLAAHSPRMAAEEVASARRYLPIGRISGFEIGNEPDNYRHGYVGYTRAVPGGPGDWGFSFTARDFTSLFGAYVHAIRRVMPKVRFAGPSDASLNPLWLNALMVSRPGREVSLITQHAYPGVRACNPPSSAHYPRAATYLNDSTAEGVAHSLQSIVAAARQAGRPLRLTEVGSSTCGGLKGQTDTFATALWLPDFLFSLMNAGIAGVNVHTRGNGYPNAALLYTQRRIYPEPLFYGMLLFTRTLGPAATLLQVERTGGPARLKVWAVSIRGGTLHVLYINKSPYDTAVELHAGSGLPAVAQRLSAPSITSNKSVELAGQRLSEDGRWRGKLVAKHVRAERGSYRLVIPALSAALLTIPGIQANQRRP